MNILQSGFGGGNFTELGVSLVILLVILVPLLWGSWRGLLRGKVDLDEVGGNLLRTFIALFFWIAVASLVQTLLAPIISAVLALFVGIAIGFVVVFSVFSYWYYR